MLRWLAGIGVLLLLSVFFSYLLAPMVPRVRKRIRFGRRGRPISDAAALVLIYLCFFLPAAVLWRTSHDSVLHWIEVTAPRSVDRLFSGGSTESMARTLGRAPLPASTRATLI